MALSKSEYEQLSDPKFFSRLLSYGFSLVKRQATAEDLVQDTIVKILTNQDKFQSGSNLAAWANTILRNTYFSQFAEVKGKF